MVVDEAGMGVVVGGQEGINTTVTVLDHMNDTVAVAAVTVLEEIMLTVQVWLTCFYHITYLLLFCKFFYCFASELSCYHWLLRQEVERKMLKLLGGGTRP